MFIRRVSFRSFSSNFKPANKIRVRSDALQSVLSQNVNEIDWESVRKELITNEKHINPVNLDGIIIEKCNKDKRLDAAKSYVNFLKSHSLAINEVSISKLLRLFYRHHRGTVQEHELENYSLSEEDEEQIIKYSNSLTKKHQLLDATIAENVIHGLSLTREWLKCLDLLCHIQLTSSTNTSTYCCIILKALEEENLDIAWKLLNEMFSKRMVPSTAVLVKYFSMFQKDDSNTEKMLEAISSSSLMLHEINIDKYCNVFSTSRDCEIVKIDRNGKCPSCSSKLPLIKLDETEFNKLSNTFLNNVMIRRDVFLKTSPNELTRFMRFVDQAMPFDCVIDGLNVAYSRGNQQPVMLVKNVSSVALQIYSGFH